MYISIRIKITLILCCSTQYLYTFNILNCQSNNAFHMCFYIYIYTCTHIYIFGQCCESKMEWRIAMGIEGSNQTDLMAKFFFSCT